MAAMFRQAKEAQGKAADLRSQAKAALKDAKKVVAELQNQQEEISVADLSALVDCTLEIWKSNTSPENFQVSSLHRHL